MTEIMEREITPDDRFMVIASDGVWEYIENHDVIRWASLSSSTYPVKCMKMVIPYYEKGLVEQAADKLIFESTNVWRRVIRFPLFPRAHPPPGKFSER